MQRCLRGHSLLGRWCLKTASLAFTYRLQLCSQKEVFEDRTRERIDPRSTQKTNDVGIVLGESLPFNEKHAKKKNYLGSIDRLQTSLKLAP